MIRKPFLTASLAAAATLAAALGFLYLRAPVPSTPSPAAVSTPAPVTSTSVGVTTANRREYYLQCRPCHSVTQPDGTVTMTGSGLGADLYGIIGRPAALQEGFAYSNSLRDAAAKGLVWTVENILDYAANPKEFLRAQTGDPKAEGTMVYKLVKGQDDLISYLRAVGPQS